MSAPESRLADEARVYLTRQELCRRWGISRATSYRYEAAGLLPKPLRFGPGSVRWSVAEVEQYERRAAEGRES